MTDRERCALIAALDIPAWTAELAGAFRLLSKPQVQVLALYSIGILLAGRCGLACVAFALAEHLGEPFDRVRERLRDWYCSAKDKSGRKRRDLPVRECFAPLLAWVLRDWAGGQLALALDATTLGQRFTALTISVLYRGSAIPVAWAILPATAKNRHKPHWLDLLERLRPAVPDSLEVLVLADRGLYAKWLFRAITAAGWHPMLRINTQNADFRPEGGEYRPLKSLLPRVGSSYAAWGTIFRSSKARLACTLCACWAEGCKEGWFVLTDLPPERARAAWYGLRSWIERGFKHAKSGGWNWQDTRMEDPQRAERQWLAMAVADVYVMRHGSAREPASFPSPPSSQPEDAASQAAAPGPAQAPPASAPARRRRGLGGLSVFRMGLIMVQAILLAGSPPPRDRFAPEPWPDGVPIVAAAAPRARSP